MERTFDNPYIEQQYKDYLSKRSWDLTGAENYIKNLENSKVRY